VVDDEKPGAARKPAYWREREKNGKQAGKEQRRGMKTASQSLFA